MRTPVDRDPAIDAEPLQTPWLGHARKLFGDRSSQLDSLPCSSININCIREYLHHENYLAGG